jgi:hypothetical protein
MATEQTIKVAQQMGLQEVELFVKVPVPVGKLPFVPSRQLV